MRAQLGEAAVFFATLTPLNTIAWRIVVRRDRSYAEGFYSFFDTDKQINFDDFPNQPQLINALKDNWAAQRMAWFTHGFYSLREINGQAVLADLRMGQEPGYAFQFALARERATDWTTLTSQAVGSRGDAAKLLPWLWARIKGQDIAPPR